jgi:hypothetical protein
VSWGGVAALHGQEDHSKDSQSCDDQHPESAAASASGLGSDHSQQVHPACWLLAAAAVLPAAGAWLAALPP